jgi:archaemetzincin
MRDRDRRISWAVHACLAAFVFFVACRAEERPRTQAPPMQPITNEPAVEPRIAAIGTTSYLSPPLQRAFDPADHFEPMPEPGPHDWLAQHREKPQSFGQFLNQDTRVPGPQRRIIYLLPIGEFPQSAPPLPALSKIVHAFFTLEVRVLPAVPSTAVAAKTRIHPSTGKRQLLAPDVLRWLTKRLPEDAFGLMAITMEDLYPEESWNFVFGMASLGERVGVQSFARQDPAFFGERREAGWQELALRRATWTLVHEISHMFGLTHCVYWKCVVAGSNHQAEADRRPLHPCPVCLRKLHSAIDFDPAVRETKLAEALRELGIDDEAEWSERRARWIREGIR